MGVEIKNVVFDEDLTLITRIKRAQIKQSGGTPSDQSGGHLSPGGECFAPIYMWNLQVAKSGKIIKNHNF